MNERIFARTATNRRAIAGILEDLPSAAWDAPTLCAGWTVRHLAAHLLQPMIVGFGRFFLTALRFRGDTDATIDHLARRIARHEPGELVALLRTHADDRTAPPRVGPIGPFAETLIHQRDIARPLGISADAPRADWLDLLDYLTSDSVVPALVPAGRIDGVSLRATDATWRRGEGPEVRGDVEAIGMAVTGRRVALADLAGPGTPILAARL